MKKYYVRKTEGKRSLGRHTQIWMDDIKTKNYSVKLCSRIK
jgi:hypothetical protein